MCVVFIRWEMDFLMIQCNGDGNADIYPVRSSESDLKLLVTSQLKIQVKVSLNGSLAVYTSECKAFNIWLPDTTTGRRWNRHGTPGAASTTKEVSLIFISGMLSSSGSMARDVQLIVLVSGLVMVWRLFLV